MASEYRESDGRFKKGCKPGPGRPPRDYEQRLATLCKRVPHDEWGDAVAAVLGRAKMGDVKAFEALAKYLLPKPEVVANGGESKSTQIVIETVDDWYGRARSSGAKSVAASN